MIKCLPVEVQGKLRSGVALPSLQQCVEELILNSIDAEATCVGVRMDMEAFKVQVIDNGAGLTAEDLECVGIRYHTSKCRTVEDLERLQWYGFRGEALASIASLAMLLEVSSRTRSSAKTHVRIFQGGKARDVFEAQVPRPSAGTTVIVCNFFHNVPVRRKRMDPVLEAERIRHRVEAVALMHPSVSFTLKNDCTGAMLVQLPKARDTYHRFVQIHGLCRAQNLREVSHTQGQFSVSGHISIEGHYNNSLQFLYVNGRLLLKTQIHKLLNNLLRRLSSLQRNDNLDGESLVRSPKSKRSHELHGVYVININCPYSEYDICLEPAKTLIEFREWDAILLCVEEAVKAFLKRENLTSEVPPEELDYSNLSGSLPVQDQGQRWCASGRAAGSALKEHCNIAVKLASHSVQRKSKDGTSGVECGGCPQSSAMERSPTAEDGGLTGDVSEEKGQEESKNSEPVAEPQSCPVRVEPTSSSDLHQEKAMLRLSCPGSKEVELCDKESVTLQTESGFSCGEQMSKETLQTGRGHGAATKQKISLSDPYFHECLQNTGPVHFSRSAHHKVLAQKCEEGASEVRRRLLRGAERDRTPPKRTTQDFVCLIPPKTQRVSAGPKVSLSKEPGSLEKFRRIYGKWNKLETRLGDEVNPPRAGRCGGITMRPAAGCLHKDQQQSDAADRKEADLSPRSPAALLASNSQPASVPSGGEQSLASKLRLLKQQGVNPSDAVPLSQDSNNNRDLRCVLNSEPSSARSTDLQPAVADEAADEASRDWIPHYDPSLGKSAYVNKVTGLSRYGAPPAEETRVRCTSDITTMAVDVVSEMGENPRWGDRVSPRNTTLALKKITYIV